MTTDSSSSFERDDLVLAELKCQNIKGLTNRGKVAVTELADQDQGAIIFLILSLNSRIRDLEDTLGNKNQETKH